MKATLRFWGVRGSLAAGNSEFGSHTSCVELDLGNHTSVFWDAGSGIRAATEKRKFKKVILCLSHFHWDHIQGLPFLGTLDDPNCELQVISGFSDIESRLQVLFDERFHPVSFKEIQRRMNIRSLKEGETMTLETLKLSCSELHHPGTSFCFRLSSTKNSVLYATDSDYRPVPAAAEPLLKDAEWAILDSQYLVGDSIAKAHYGHASFKQAVDVASKYGIKNIFLFHYDPSYSDEDLRNLEDQAEKYATETFGVHSPKVRMAREGASFDMIF